MRNDKDTKDTIRFGVVICVIFIFLVAIIVSAFLEDAACNLNSHKPSGTKYASPTFPIHTYASFPTFTVPSLHPFDPDDLPEKEPREIELVRVPGRVGRNEIATINIKGEPYTKYSITVMYPSGESTARGLDDKWSDKNGYVTWQWKIGGQTSFGTHRAIITDGINTITVYFTVTG